MLGGGWLLAAASAVVCVLLNAAGIMERLVRAASVGSGLVNTAVESSPPDYGPTRLDQLGELATSDAMWRGSALERCLRDARMLRMHASVYSSVLERAGKVQLGVTEVDHLL
jgi:hypothetical protein